MNKLKPILFLFFLQFINESQAQQKATDVTAPLHALQPDYPVPYGAPSVTSVKSVLDKLF